MILAQENGNTALTAIKHDKIKPGSLFIECVYLLEVASSLDIQASRYLPATTVRIVIDHSGQNYTELMSHDLINASRIHVEMETAKKVIRTQEGILRQMITQSESLAQAEAPAILDAAHLHTKQTLLAEINRLKALREVNPNVRDDEIRFF